MDNLELGKLALMAKEKSYAPYSGFRVGAAVETEDGSVYTGANIENISFGATVCAEQTAVFGAVLDGYRKLRKIAVAADTERPVMPCGICRQVLSEFCSSDALIICCSRYGDMNVYTLEQLMPFSFNEYDSLQKGEDI